MYSCAVFGFVGGFVVFVSVSVVVSVLSVIGCVGCRSPSLSLCCVFYRMCFFERVGSRFERNRTRFGFGCRALFLFVLFVVGPAQSRDVMCVCV